MNRGLITRFGRRRIVEALCESIVKTREDMLTTTSTMLHQWQHHQKMAGLGCCEMRVGRNARLMYSSSSRSSSRVVMREAFTSGCGRRVESNLSFGDMVKRSERGMLGLRVYGVNEGKVYMTSVGVGDKKAAVCCAEGEHGGGNTGGNNGDNNGGRGDGDSSSGGDGGSRGVFGMLWAAYLLQLDKNPVFVKSWTSGLLNGLGDVVAQLLFEKDEEFNWKRLGIFTFLVGFVGSMAL